MPLAAHEAMSVAREEEMCPRRALSSELWRSETPCAQKQRNRQHPGRPTPTPIPFSP